MKGLLLAVLLAVQAAPEDKNPGHLKMALVNLKCATSASADEAANQAAIQANLKRMFAFVDKLAAEGAEFIGFPELSVNGYAFSKTMAWLSLDGPEVKALKDKAVAKGVYLSAGIAEKDKDGRTWNTQVVISPKGELLCAHHKTDLTKEKGFTEAGTAHEVFAVKGAKVGIAVCAEGSFKNNLQALADGGATIVYGPHANTTGNTIAGWYKFRAPWAGPEGWMAQLKMTAAIHNHAGVYGTDVESPAGASGNSGWASGAWFIGPDGSTLAQMPSSAQKADSKEYVLVFNVPLPAK